VETRGGRGPGPESGLDETSIAGLDENTADRRLECISEQAKFLWTRNHPGVLDFPVAFTTYKRYP